MIFKNNDFDKTLLAIDPGLNNSGFSVFRFNELTKVIYNIETFTIYEEATIDIGYKLNGLETNRFNKILRMRECFNKILTEYNPTIFVAESAFFNHNSPDAFGSLTQIVTAYKLAAFDFNNNMYFFDLAPKLVKKLFGVSLSRNKLEIKSKIKSNNEITSVLNNNIDLLDQHSTDSIIIGYTYIKTFYK